MTPLDMPSFDPYLIALLDGNLLTLAFISAFSYAMVKTTAKMSKRTEGSNVWEWIAEITGSIVNFRKKNGDKNGPTTG